MRKGSLVAAFLFIAASGADGSAFGPASGHAGNPPGNDTCVNCHASYDLNSGDGSLDLLDVPGSFTPGATYTLTVRLADPGQSRWGFQLTVLDDEDPLAQGGALVVIDSDHTQMTEDIFGTEDYLMHTEDGTYEGAPGPATWSFDWVAPETVPSVTFYLAGNAADGDHSPSGDYIYAVHATVGTGPTAVTSTTWSRIKALYRR
jgi:hypothetical protein